MARARSKQTMGRRLTGAVGCVLLASAFVQGCAYPSHRWGYDRQLLAADRMADHGDYEGARAAYEALAWETVREDDLRYVRYRLAYLYELQGEFARAIEAYSAIAADWVMRWTSIRRRRSIGLVAFNTTSLAKSTPRSTRGTRRF